MIKRARRVRPAGFVRIDDGPHRACAAYFLPGGAALFPLRRPLDGTPPAGSRGRGGIGLVYVAVAVINWNARFLQCAGAARLERLLRANSSSSASSSSAPSSAAAFAILLRADPADPLAALADRRITCRAGWRTAGIIACGSSRQCRQHPSAHRQRRLSLHPAHA